MKPTEHPRRHTTPLDSRYATAAMGAVLAVTVLHGMIHGYSIFLSPLNDQMRLYFGADTISAITAMKTTYLAVYAAGNLLFGVLTNRVSARLTLASGMVLNGVAVALFSTVGPDGITQMHLLWALAAFGGSVYHPIANVLITRLYPTRKGMVLGISGVGAAVGFAFAPLVTGLLSGALGFTWQQVALVFGAAGVAIGIASWYFIPPPSDQGVAAVEPAPVDATALNHEPAAHNRESSVTQPRLSVVVLTMVMAIACLREIAMWSILDISDFFLTAVLADSTRTGFFLFLLYLPGVFVKPMVGVLSDRLGRKRLVSSSLVFYGLTIAATAVGGPLTLIPIYLLMGVGQAATIPSIEAIVADTTTERNRGLVFGVFTTAGIGFGALGPLISGAAIDALGGTEAAFRLWMVVLGGLPLIGGLVFASLRFPTSRPRTAHG